MPLVLEHWMKDITAFSWPQRESVHRRSSVSSAEKRRETERERETKAHKTSKDIMKITARIYRQLFLDGGSHARSGRMEMILRGLFDTVFLVFSSSLFFYIFFSCVLVRSPRSWALASLIGLFHYGRIGMFDP